MAEGDGIPLIRLRGAPGDCGLAYAPQCAHLLTRSFREAYLADMSLATNTPRELVRAQSAAWLERLPAWAQEEIDGVSRGAHAHVADTAEFLYADIATSTGGANSITIPAHDEAQAATPEEEILSGGGAGCTGMVARAEHERAVWAARNCDWLVATLRRGTAAVVHETPGRIPVMALGLLGDIDLDTGVNAQRLWLHLHTLPAADKSRPDRTRFSWLFWAREALETCATLDELERFIARTDRDRGIIAIAVDGKTDEAALFECGRSTYARLAPGEGAHGMRDVIVATNHCQHRHPREESFAPGPGGAPARATRRGSTVGRYQRVREILRAGPVGHGAHDLAEILADEHVEMREATQLRTIYSATCAPSRGEVWFAHGDFASRAPAASSGTWRRVPWPWDQSRGL